MVMNKKSIFVWYGISYFILLILFSVYFRPLMDLDNKYFLLVNGFSNPLFDTFFQIITHLGSGWFWIIAIAALWIANKRKLATYLAVGALIDTVSVFVLKDIFLRPRPFEVLQNVKLLDMEAGYSFPSGHSSLVFMSAAVINKYYFYAIAILVAISRIYLGVHYPFDVLIGGLNGIFIGLMVLNLDLKDLQSRLENIWKRIVRMR